MGCLESKPLSLLPSLALNILPSSLSLCHLHLPRFLSRLTFSSEWRCASATPVTCPWPVMQCAHSQSSRWWVFFPESNINFHNWIAVFSKIIEYIFEFRIFVDSPSVQTPVKLRISGRPIHMPQCSSTLYQRCGLESTQVTGLMINNLTEKKTFELTQVNICLLVEKLCKRNTFLIEENLSHSKS